MALPVHYFQKLVESCPDIIIAVDKQGTITFEEYSETGPTAKRLNVTIPRQTIHGLWQAITETQQVALPPDYARTSRWPGR